MLWTGNGNEIYGIAGESGCGNYNYKDFVWDGRTSLNVMDGR